MRYEVRASKPIATELTAEPTLSAALDHAVTRIDDGFVVTMTDTETGEAFDQHQIWSLKVDSLGPAPHRG